MHLHSPLQEYLNDVVTDLLPLRDGEVYDVTSSVVNPNPDLLSITLTTVSGHQYCAGDHKEPFAIQSIAKAVAYGMALDDLGPEKVLEKVDVEPSGDPFNEISLQHGTGRPDNPMINAGAIATVGLLKGRGGRDRFGRIHNVFERLAAGSPGELKMSNAIFQAEDRRGHRNRALAWLLRSFDIIDHDPESVVQDYFRECSVEVTTENLSMMAATLANRGVNPITEEHVFSEDTTRQLLSVMSTCGMYDSAGDWAIDVGLPAKSGVGGGLMVVVPGQLGIGVFSPPLDEHGNSVRATEAVKRITRDLGLHSAAAPPLGRSTLRAQYSLADSSSGVVRSHELAELTDEFGTRAQILDVSGDLGFAETETIARTIVEMEDEVSMVLLDLQGVDQFGKSAIRFLVDLTVRMRASNRDLIIIDDGELIDHMLEFAAKARLPLPDPREKARAAAEGELDLSGGPDTADSVAQVRGEFRLFEYRGAALEWAELRLAQRYGKDHLPEDTMEPEHSPLFSFLDDDDAETLISYMETHTYKAGSVIRRVGQLFGGIYFIESGRVELTAQGSDGTKYRQVYLSPGMTFGEVALGRTGRQQSTIRAVDEVTCMVLSSEMIDTIEKTDPPLGIKLWTALAREAFTVLEQSSREAGARED